jgi:hypothetical protein
MVYREFNEIPVNCIQTYKVFSAALFWPHKKCVKKMVLKALRKN